MLIADAESTGGQPKSSESIALLVSLWQRDTSLASVAVNLVFPAVAAA